MLTTEVENYPGFRDGIMGPDLMGEMRAQAERFGAEFLTEKVSRVDFAERPFRVRVRDDEYRADTIIVSTESSGETSRVAEEITELLRYHHNIGFADPDDFTVRTMERRGNRSAVTRR